MRKGLAFLLLCGVILSLGAPLGHADGGAPPPQGAPQDEDETAAPAPAGDGGSATVTQPFLFIDVPADHWAVEDLKFLVENGIVTGLPNGTFNGSQPLTRYDAAALIARAVRFALSHPAQVQGTDVTTLQELLFELSDQVEANRTGLDALNQKVASLPGGATPQLEARLAQAEDTIQALQTQLTQMSRRLETAPTAPDSAQLSQLQKRVNANFIIGIAGLFVGIIGVALATMT